MSQQDVQGTTKYIQINESWTPAEQTAEINRALRYTWEQLAQITGSLGKLQIASDLDFMGFRGVNAGDPQAGQDLVTKAYADTVYIAKSTSVNPGPTGTPADNPGTGSGSGAQTTGNSNKQLARWDTSLTIGSARVRDDDTYIIVGTGTTDAAVTSNALVVGSSANAGDLLVVRTGTNSESIRLLPGTAANLIKSDITGAGTYRDLAIYTNNAEALRINTGGDATATRDLIANVAVRFKSGTAFRGTLQHVNTGNRAYSFPDETCDLAYKTSTALTAHALVIGASGGGTTTGRIDVLADLGTTTKVLHGNAAGDPTFSAVSLTADVTGVLPVANGGSGGLGVVARGAVTGQTGAVASVCSYTPSNADHSFEIGAYIDVTAFTAGTISLQCTYTDPSGNPQTLTMPVVSLAGTIGTTVGSLTDAQAIVLSVETSGANPITIQTIVTVFTGTYNVYGWIKIIA